MKIKKFIKKHYWVIILAVLLGILMVLPQFLIATLDRDSFFGFYPFVFESEPHFLTTIQEVFDGHYKMGNPFLQDGKDLPNSHSPMLGPIIAAWTGEFFGADYSVQAGLINKFIFPPILFFVIYLLAYNLTLNKKISLLAAVLTVFGYHFFEYYQLVKFFDGTMYTSGDPSKYSRLIHPQISSLFFFLIILFSWQFFKTSKYIWAIITSILFGLSFYVYPYVWSFFIVFFGVAGLYFLFRKNWSVFLKIILLFILGLIIAIPYLINFYQLFNHPNYPDLQMQFGFVSASHKPVFSFLLTVAILSILIFWYQKRKSLNFIFIILLLLTSYIVINQQVITGKSVQSGHYHWYFLQPLSILIIVIVGYTWLKEKLYFWPKILNLLLISLILIAIFHTTLLQVTTYYVRKDRYLAKQYYREIFDWFNIKAQKEEVVYTAEEEMAEYLTAYTSLNTYWSYRDKFYLNPLSRIKHNIFLWYRLRGFSPEEIKEVFFKERADLSKLIFGMYYRELFNDPGKIPDEVLESLANEYTEFYREDIETQLKKYPVDYLVYNKDTSLRLHQKTDLPTYIEWQIDELDFLEPVYERPQFTIYRVK